MKKFLVLLFAILIIILVGGKIYTDAIVQNAEAKYPPAKFVTAENVRLHYLEAGSGPPVVIIPGGSGKIQDFSHSPLYPLVLDEYKVIIFDRPGLGYSEKPAEEATPEVQARLIHSAIKELGYEKPLILGQSWGGVIALAYAQAYPNDLSGMLLLGTAPYPRERNTDIFNVIARTPMIGDLIVHTIYVPIGRHWVAPAMLKQNKDYFSPLDTVPAGYYDATLEMGLRPSHVKTTAAETRIIPASLAALVENLDKIDVPVMIVAGDLDKHAMEQSVHLQEDLPASKVKVVEGTNHYLWFSKPEVVMETIRELWIWSDEFHASK
ncbi:MAG: alpha/beta hydrolase [Chloroflexi bacterium]|nr:MAG: alpha/beta hydrolase [Chloroflexota bacterium]